MNCASDTLIQRLHTEFPQTLANQPLHLGRNISDINISTSVERVREDVDLVAVVDELFAFRFANVGGQHADRPVAQGDQVALVAVGPTKDTTDSGGFGDVVERSVAAGDEDGEVWGLLGKPVAPYFREVEWVADLLLVLFVDALDGGIFLRESPHLKLDWIGDSGCTLHMCNNKSLFTELTSISSIITTTGKLAQVIEIGTARI